MSKNMVVKSKELTLRDLADAAVIIAVFLVLASQQVRSEPFEVEKVALLGILTLVIMAANVIEYLQTPEILKQDFISLRRSPLSWAVMLLLGSALLSTVFSL